MPDYSPPGLPLIIAAHQIQCGTCAWCLAGNGWPEQRQITRHAYPGQPATRTRPPTPRCTCWYRLHHDEPAPIHGPYVKCDDFTSKLFHDCWWRWTFTINPDCPHHGREVLILNPALPAELTIEALWNDPALNAMRDPYDLDDNERRS